MKGKNPSTSKKSTKNNSRPMDRNFGIKPDRELGKYLQKRGLSSIAEILKIDK